MKFFSKGNTMKYLVMILISLFFVNFIGCAALSTAKYPETPTGRFALYASTYHALVDQYNDELIWATNEIHQEVLAKRKIGIIEIYGPAMLYKEAVVTGAIPSYELERQIIARLGQLKRLVYTYQSIVPTEDKLDQMLIDAGAAQKFEARGSGSIIILLIELAQTFAPFLTSLINQSTMTPEQIQAKFDAEAAWLEGFNPHLLADPVLKE